MNVRKHHQQVSPSAHLELSVTNPRRLCREGDDMDFFRASLPGSLGDLVGHGVRGTYPEAGCSGQETPMSGDLPFLARLRPPNRFLIVAPEIRDIMEVYQYTSEGMSNLSKLLILILTYRYIVY